VKFRLTIICLLRILFFIGLVLDDLIFRERSMFVKFYFPSKDNKGRILDEKKANSEFNRVIAKFCEYFGGVTVTEGHGYFLSAEKSIIAEPVRIIASYTDTVTDAVKVDLCKLANKVKQILSQESLMIEFAEKAEFI